MLEKELNWLADVVQGQLQQYFLKKEGKHNEDQVTPLKPPESGENEEYLNLIRRFKLAAEERLVLILGLSPHISPNFLDDVIQTNLKNSGDFPQIGGTRGKTFRGMLPTGETALFLLAGDDQAKRTQVQELFAEEHQFARNRILWLEAVPHGEPRMSGRIIVNPDIVDQLLSGKVSQPRFSMDFPAEYITTELDDNDLVLDKKTRAQIAELQNWLKHQDTLMNQWNLKRWVKPGYRVLFHGPPGTGKTLTAMILGKNTGRDVFRIDLSMVVSKYIGETEKNLSQLFDRAKSKDWILFFDEADALFGKRTSVRDAHDKYANQEVAYLLQKIESHDGLVILASNFKTNIDEAFMRRFQSVIYFPPPTPAERFMLWKKTLPERKGLKIPGDEILQTIAKKYEITGAGVVNVVQYCSLACLANKKHEITVDLIQAGIEREYQKEGKVF
ncbi:MAG: ATP-binding protein [Bacteroidales bacterium]|nr:ATP-binding protein [Bacteroidales bacterium]